MTTTGVRTTHADVYGDFADRDAVWLAFLEVLGRVAGVTVLTSVRHDFPGGGLSGVVVIAESHAAIHTWPERGVAYVMLATCGLKSSLDEFEREVVRAWPFTPEPDWHRS